MKTIRVTDQEAAAIHSLSMKLEKTKQLTLEPLEPKDEQDRLHHFPQKSRDMINELWDKLGISWLQVKDDKVKSIQYKYRVANLGSLIRKLEERGLAKMEERTKGTRTFIEAFKLNL